MLALPPPFLDDFDQIRLPLSPSPVTMVLHKNKHSKLIHEYILMKFAHQCQQLKVSEEVLLATDSVVGGNEK